MFCEKISNKILNDYNYTFPILQAYFSIWGLSLKLFNNNLERIIFLLNVFQLDIKENLDLIYNIYIHSFFLRLNRS